uniref:Protein kinase domain-containing protein n=1 Tax=Oryzias melastigma TaxID=30732 RepID=A0A3B3D7Y9_ORYME
MSNQGNMTSEPYDVQTGFILVGYRGLYRVGEFKGQGGYGKVAKCTKIGSQDSFAIKILTDVTSGQEEFEAMKLIQDLDPDKNNLLKLHECFPFKNVFCLVYEVLEETVYNISYEYFWDLHDIRPLVRDMCQALGALKSINVAHCDLKSDNIMLVDKESFRFKLIDFGLARKAETLTENTQIQVTPFRAPEVILGLPTDESVDMWALGMVLASLYYGYYPFSGKTEYDTIRALVQVFGVPENRLLKKAAYSGYFFSWEQNKTHKWLSAFIDLLRRMLQIDPQRRITPSQALQHDFITMKHLSGDDKVKYATACFFVPVPSPDKCRGNFNLLYKYSQNNHTNHIQSNGWTQYMGKGNQALRGSVPLGAGVLGPPAISPRRETDHRVQRRDNEPLSHPI